MNELFNDTVREGVLRNLCYDPRSPLIFSSAVFLFLFAGFSLVYGLLQRRTALRLLFVTLFSYYFYYKSSGFYFFLLAVVTVSDYGLALCIHRFSARRAVARLCMGGSLLVDLGLLAYFKYTNFFGECWTSLSGSHFQPMDIFLPVGISFFTFQSLSYTIDVYRGQLAPLRNLLDYAFFVSFFPQLVAGPKVLPLIMAFSVLNRITEITGDSYFFMFGFIIDCGYSVIVL